MFSGKSIVMRCDLESPKIIASWGKSREGNVVRKVSRDDCDLINV